MLIYKTTNLVNNKIYIGVTNGKDPHYLGSGQALKHAFVKYGRCNFIRETLYEIEDKELAYFVEELIVDNDFINDPTNYNLQIGGCGLEWNKGRREWAPMSDEQKNKISETMKERGTVVGKNNPFYGKKHSEESRKKMSIARSKYKLTDEHKAKISASQIGQTRSHKGRPLSEDHKQKLRDGHARRKASGVKRKSPIKCSDEHRRKLSNATKKYWARKKKGDNS